MPTAPEILESAGKRVNPFTQAQGYLTRNDIVEFLQSLGSIAPAEKFVKFQEFIQSAPFLNEKDKEKIINDYESYR